MAHEPVWHPQPHYRSQLRNAHAPLRGSRGPTVVGGGGRSGLLSCFISVLCNCGPPLVLLIVGRCIIAYVAILSASKHKSRVCVWRLSLERLGARAGGEWYEPALPTEYCRCHGPGRSGSLSIKISSLPFPLLHVSYEHRFRV